MKDFKVKRKKKKKEVEQNNMIKGIIKWRGTTLKFKNSDTETAPIKKRAPGKRQGALIVHIR